MIRKSRAQFGVLCVLSLLSVAMAVWAADAATQATQPSRPDAKKQMADGNFKVAYDMFSKLALDPKDDPKAVADDLHDAIDCLGRLNRVNEVDAFREKVIAAHANNWRLLAMAAGTYMEVAHHGVIISGAFQRGDHRGGGQYVNSFERDRVRALQLCVQATEKLKGEEDAVAVANFYLQFANTIMGQGQRGAWRLGYLTDLSTLPDYAQGYYYYGDGSIGAPVDEDGKPIYYSRPKTFGDARNDGERWRWALMQAAEASSAKAAEVQWIFAGFLHSQFGVQTMAYYGWYGRGWEGVLK